MHVLNTSAADFNSMLALLRNFLDANGWSVTTDNASTGTIVMANANGHNFQITSTTTARTDFYTGAFTDRSMRITYDRTIIGASAGQNTRCDTNDMQGPYSNLWFFTDDAATYCHIVAQTAAARYTHASFGDLDNKGIHTEDLPFVAGLYWQYWSDSANYTNSNYGANPFNMPWSFQHSVGLTDGTSGTDRNLRVGIPDGLLDPSLFFTDGPIVDASIMQLCDRDVGKTTGGNNSARLLDYFCNIDNGGYTGSIMLSPFPMVTRAASQTVQAYIGDVPGIALVNMMALSPGQTLTFGDEEWIVFPIKQFGTQEAAQFGSNPLPQPNSWRFGYAIKSVEA